MEIVQSARRPATGHWLLTIDHFRPPALLSQLGHPSTPFPSLNFGDWRLFVIGHRREAVVGL
jgi:hypothetical protein